MAAESSALISCKACIDQGKSFLLQGGAGSGKTESLKELLLYIKQTKPHARVVCITHTNAAVDEIVSRVGEGYQVSTIHSFLYGLIRHYRKNIWEVLPTLFQLQPIDPKCEDHEVYKKLHNSYGSLLYRYFSEPAVEAAGKREYCGDHRKKNRELNEKIAALNGRIAEHLAARELPDQFYNETKFDRFSNATFGHDGLLKIFHALYGKHELFQKILRDKFDYIFVDEYQDTNADILRDLLDLSRPGKTAVGLFGDHMQSIYDQEALDLDSYIDAQKLERISKGDNYRCSYEVIDLVNALRFDEIEQKVAFKEVGGVLETEADRHGSVQVWYAVADSKKQHNELLERMIAKAKVTLDHPKVLMLTNKEVARQNGFPMLYKIFADCYSDARERVEAYLWRIHALDVAELCRLYERKQYNELIIRAKKGGFSIITAQDQRTLRHVMEKLLTDKRLSLWDAVELAASHRLIRKSELCENELRRRDTRSADSRYLEFADQYENGLNTYPKLKKVWPDVTREEFDSLKRKWKKAEFYQTLFSDQVKFHEVRSYLKYLEEDTDCITMHKTKGTSIDSVVVVMDEYGWTKDYDFKLIPPSDGENQMETDKQKKSRKLIYVACSRARKDLICIRVLKSDEEAAFTSTFPGAVKMEAESQ